jgi:type II secretion system protein G
MKFFAMGTTLLIAILLLWFVSVDSDGHRARPAATKAQIAAFLAALENYKSDVGEFPTEAQGLRALRIDPGVSGWNGPYLVNDVPADPWGEPYKYRVTDGKPRVFSLWGWKQQGRKNSLSRRCPVTQPLTSIEGQTARIAFGCPVIGPGSANPRHPRTGDESWDRFRRAGQR